MADRKKEFTIQRGNRWERTVVGIDGHVHTMEPARHGDGSYKYGRNGHFTDKRQYDRAIGKAVRINLLFSRTTKADVHPRRPSSVYAISGGLPGLGKRR